MKKKITGLLPLVLLSGCLVETTGGPGKVTSLRSPDDASREIRHQSQGNIIGDYNHRIPIDPEEWRKLNKEQTEKSGGGS